MNTASPRGLSCRKRADATTALLVASLLGGCVNPGSISSGVDVSNGATLAGKQIFVEINQTDEREIYRALYSLLADQGLTVGAGVAATMHSDTDIVVRYDARWAGVFPRYVSSIQVSLIDRRFGQTIAYGTISQEPYGAIRSADELVREIMTSVLLRTRQNELAVTRDRDPVVSRGGTIIHNIASECASFRARHAMAVIPELRQVAQRLRQTDAADPTSAELRASLVRELVSIEPLGCAILEQFGECSRWPDAVLQSYVAYATSDDAEVDECERRLDTVLQRTGESGLVTVETERPSASVKYVPALFFRTQTPEVFTSPTTPSRQAGITIGRYHIWTERAGVATSSQDVKFWILSSNDNPFEIIESEDAPR